MKWLAAIQVAYKVYAKIRAHQREERIRDRDKCSEELCEQVNAYLRDSADGGLID